VQESLTNTFRHAGPATAAVSLTYLNAELLVEVTDTGRGRAAFPGPGTAAGTGASGPRGVDLADRPPGVGHGLAGMRERAASVGGTVEAGPLAASGFRVAAWLPAPAAGGPAAPVSPAGVADGDEAADGAEDAERTGMADGARAGYQTAPGSS
jgi:glucose-6-phosphate-specific signal transduction histidine kinase